MGTRSAKKIEADTGAKPGRARRNKRLDPEQRSRDIVDQAIKFFSEVGFEGGTRELARRIGVTQPLLYRYFPSKEDLIREVYRTVYLNRWQPEWDALLQDRRQALRRRLQQFYLSYTDAIFTREWMRIYLFSGLRGLDINKWYVEIVEERILKRICLEYRHELGLGSDDERVSEPEMELAWTLHGGIYYYGVRKHIYQFPVAEDKKMVIGNALDAFFNGAEPVIRAAAKRR